MLRYAEQATFSDLLHLTAAIEPFDGACDPEFDQDLQELERQFAEIRLAFNHD